MLVNETFEAHQELVALSAALTWYSEETLWIYRHTIGRVTYVHVSNFLPVDRLDCANTIAVINICDESGQFLHPVRRINICEGIYISGVTNVRQIERPNRAANDSDTPV